MEDKVTEILTMDGKVSFDPPVDSDRKRPGPEF